MATFSVSWPVASLGLSSTTVLISGCSFLTCAIMGSEISLTEFICVKVSGNFGPLIELPQAAVNSSTPLRSVNDCNARTGATPMLPATYFTPSRDTSACATLAPSAALCLLS